MTDAEVVRLRKLRDAALRARALAQAFESSSANGSVFSQSGVICWTIARIASGALRAHPYLSYQRGPSRMRARIDGILAPLAAFTAGRQGRAVTAFAEELECVAREVSDVRALTWLPDLSDALGRMQLRLRRLAIELEAGARAEAGAVQPIHGTVRAGLERVALDDLGAENGWPYLAI